MNTKIVLTKGNKKLSVQDRFDIVTSVPMMRAKLRVLVSSHTIVQV